MPGNLLAEETSPYLLQHRDNPVHWRPWGEDALAEARRHDRPIMLSIGYAACHWCHVMAHESFEDAETADVMNKLFVSIKVDREERPDLDTIYQTALALLGEQGGWPLTMFLTPKGEPFWGGTYYPPEPRFGRPAFRAVLHAVAETYASRPDQVSGNADALCAALREVSAARAPAGAADNPFTSEATESAARRLLGHIDTTFGGLRGAPKFPHAPALEFLWRAYAHGHGASFKEAVTLSLTRMCQGGIYDHLGGGFSRYSTDANWLVPHFEKMLYDNALLLDLLTLVWQGDAKPLYAARIAETADWVLREMTAEGGGFAASLDADSEGEEGKFYVWSAAEIDERLGADAAEFNADYGVAPDGNWEGRNILNRSHRDDLGNEKDEARLAAMRQVLLAARAGRIRPGWDDKVLADWNGLMIAALANAGAVFKRADWRDAAIAAFAFVADRLGTPDGRLKHSWRAGIAKHAGMLADYAEMARAAIVLYQCTGDDAYRARAAEWVATLDRHFWDADSGGYFDTADDARDLITRTRTAADNATPAGNTTMVWVLGALDHLGGGDARANGDYRARATAIADAFATDVARNLIPMTGLLNQYERLAAPLQVVIAGAADDAATEALLDTVRARSLPNLLLVPLAPGAALAAGHPAAGKDMVAGTPTAYVCPGQTCLAPFTDAAALGDALDAYSA